MHIVILSVHFRIFFLKTKYFRINIFFCFDALYIYIYIHIYNKDIICSQFSYLHLLIYFYFLCFGHLCTFMLVNINEKKKTTSVTKIRKKNFKNEFLLSL